MSSSASAGSSGQAGAAGHGASGQARVRPATDHESKQPRQQKAAEPEHAASDSPIAQLVERIERAEVPADAAGLAAAEGRWKAELEASVAANGEDSVVTAAHAARLARLYERLERADDAIALYERAYQFCIKNWNRLPLGVPGCAGEHAEALARLYLRKAIMGDAYGDAEGCRKRIRIRKLFNNARMLYELELGVGHRKAVDVEWAMAIALADLGANAEATTVFEFAYNADRMSNDSAWFASRCCLEANRRPRVLASWHMAAGGSRLQEAMHMSMIAGAIESEACEKCQARMVQESLEGQERENAREAERIECDEVPIDTSAAAACEACWKAELEARVAANGEDPDSVVTAAHAARLARLYARLERVDDAIALYERVHLFYTKNDRLPLGMPGCAGNHVAALARLYLRKAMTMSAAGAKDRDVDSYRLRTISTLVDAQNLYRVELGPCHRKVADVEWLMASTLADIGANADAIRHFESAYNLDLEMSDGEWLARRCCLKTDERLCKLLYRLESEDRSMDPTRKQLGRIVFATAKRACGNCLARNYLGTALAIMGSVTPDFAEREKYYKCALEETERRLGPTHIEVGRVLLALADTYNHAGRIAEGFAVAKRALEIHEAELGLTHRDTEEAFLPMGHAEVQARKAKIELPPADYVVYVQKLREFVKQAGRMPCSDQTAEFKGAGSVNREDPETQRATSNSAAGGRASAGGRLQRKLKASKPKAKPDDEQRPQPQVDSDAAEKAAAALCMAEAQWADARRFLDGVLERSPGDAEARALRIECALGAGQHAEAAHEVAELEASLPAGHAMLRRVQEARTKAEAASRKRAEAEAAAKKRAEKAAQRKADGKREQREREERERQEREKAAAKIRAEEEAAAAARRKAAAERERKEREERERLAEQALRERAPQHAKPAEPEPAPQDECAVCLNDMAAGPAAQRLPCGHRFHALCIARWGARGKGGSGCPQCRAPLDGPPAPAGPSAGPSAPPPAAPQQPASGSPSLARDLFAPPPAAPVPAAAPAPAPAAGSPPAPAAGVVPRPTRPYQPPGISFAERPGPSAS